MPFIAVPPAPNPEAAIDCGVFWPAIEPAAARAAMRLDGTVTPDRLREALIAGALEAMRELQDWEIAQLAAGHATLAEVPAVQVAGESAHAHNWRRAVYSLAAASITERRRDFDSTNEGHLQADKLTPTVDDHRRDARWAITDIQGRPRTTVELI
ncbi:head completion/stabilization protein [Thauera butanivorans]|uniref:head completion/stabilization protein n=1 Tax=Thauera butanivorans TaxID=86174 RepID=UPI0008391970|nr:head completion/stabilization protein [Thauera butanivorans]